MRSRCRVGDREGQVIGVILGIAAYLRSNTAQLVQKHSKADTKERALLPEFAVGKIPRALRILATRGKEIVRDSLVAERSHTQIVLADVPGIECIVDPLPEQARRFHLFLGLLHLDEVIRVQRIDL